MQRELIDRLAAYVAKAGGAFEQVSPSPSPIPNPNPNPNPNPDPGLATPSHSRTTNFPFPLTTDPTQAIIEREQSNPQYRFMLDQSLPEHAYYRWKVVSLVSGDVADAWHTTPFQLEVGGPHWKPPPCSKPPPKRSRPPDRSRSRSRSSSYSSSRSRSRSPRRGDKQRGGADKQRRVHGVEDARLPVGPQGEKRAAGQRELTDPERDELEDMLRGLTADRQRIKDCMGFCVGNAAASVEISETITEALTLPETARA